VDLGVALALILGIGIGLIFIVSRKDAIRTKRVHHREVLNKQIVKDRWTEIENTLNLGGQSHFKSAILDADKLLDHVLKGLNVSGQTLGDRLKNAKGKFAKYDDYNNLWFAHKVRNNIAHEMNHEINSAEARRALEYYKKALKELGVL
jgi:predicted DNA-binding protein YlxM (UPF0122 family)